MSALRIDTPPQPLPPDVDRALRDFWRARGAGSEEHFDERARRIIAILRDDEQIAGSCSVTPARVPALGNHWMLVYRSLLSEPHSAVESWMTMLGTAWDEVLRRREAGEHRECLGVVAPVIDPDVRASRREAVWPENDFMHAGFGAGDVPLRVRYFSDARLPLGSSS